MHVTMPYSMLEPLREVLDAGLQSDRSDVDERWMRALREEMKEAQVEISSQLTEAELTVKELLALRPGDVIPIEMPDHVLLRAEEIPVFRAHLGVSEGNVALQVVEPIGRDNAPKKDLEIVTKQSVVRSRP